MNGSVRIGRVLGVPLRMHWSVPLLIGLLGYGLGHQTLPAWIPGRPAAVYTVASVIGAVLLMVSLLAHEAAHAVTARRKDVSVQDVTLWALGGMTRMGKPRTASVALMVAVSGPLTSLVIGGAALGAGIGVHTLTRWAVPAAVLVWLGWANLVLGVFNLLPAAPLDGGRVVQAVMWWRTGDRERAERAAGRSGQVLGWVLMGVGWISVLRGATGGLWLTLIGLFMAITASAERQRASLGTALRGIRAADAMSSPVTTGPDWLTVDRFIDEVAMDSRHSTIPLLDFDGRPSGIVRIPQLAKVPPQNRAEVRARDLATPLSQCTIAAPDEQVTEVLERMRPGTGLQILVVDDGRLEGIITAHDISRLMQRHTLGGAAQR